MGRFGLALMAPILFSGAVVSGCAPAPPPRDDQKIEAIPATQTYVFPELSRDVHVVRTEHSVPHIYAENRIDMAYVLGFVTARDRYFMMELSRRLGGGRVSELLGDAALEIDQESRGSGMTYVADQIAAGLEGELADYIDAFAAGINRYIDALKRGDADIPLPSELPLANILLGLDDPTQLLEPFDRRDVAAMMAVILYQSSYETGDVGRAATLAALPTLFEGEALQDLRRQGALDDLWLSYLPVFPISSSPGFGAIVIDEAGNGSSPPGAGTQGHSGGSLAALPADPEMLARAAARLTAFEKRIGRDDDIGWGSNAWAVSGSHTVDGRALLAGDGHLALSVPSILYRMGLDTAVFGRGDTHQLGLTIAGLPLVAIGTNGRVAWSQTQLSGDITDWYLEEIELDTDGYPSRSFFDGQFRELERIDETYVIADVPVLGSEGRVEVWSRWETPDGRWIADIEGREVGPDEVVSAGEALVNMRGAYIVPSDRDGDGVISAISFDYAGFDAGKILYATDAIGHADNVLEFREATRGLVGYSQNFAVADANGNALYGAYQAFPCRDYLERDESGGFAVGSNPDVLLDGTRYGGFSIPIGEDNQVDETQTDPYQCVIPHADLPQVVNPPEGYVSTANNDPAGLTFDGDFTNDAYYIGGPWDAGFRAQSIDEGLQAAVENNGADIAAMSAVQGHIESSLGKLLLAPMLASLDHARALDNPSDPADQRVAALYAAEAEAIDEVQARLEAWAERGYFAKSGVVTVYDPDQDDGTRSDAVATTLFNAWMGRVMRGVFDDEGLPGGVFRAGGSNGRVRALNRFFKSRGDNSEGLSSYNPATNESAFFDVLGTEEIESSHEVVVGALVDALAFLRSPPLEDAPDQGGFGTDDMDAWLWGLRHYARFESLLNDFLDGDDFSGITEDFAITTAVIPLAEGLSADDPRAALKWFPRDGDQFSVDAANSGFSGESFSYTNGPVMRMVVALGPDGISGVNVIPGGQSAITESPYFADQALLWLGNETSPMRFSVDEVVAGAQGREHYIPF